MSENTQVLTPSAPHTTENNQIHRLTPLASISSNARLFNLDFFLHVKKFVQNSIVKVCITQEIGPKKHSGEKIVESTRFFFECLVLVWNKWFGLELIPNVKGLKGTQNITKVCKNMLLWSISRSMQKYAKSTLYFFNSWFARKTLVDQLFLDP